MSLSSILSYISVALILLAFIFLMIGLARTTRRYGGPSSIKVRIPAEKAERQKIIRRADWRCAASLLCGALFAYALTLVGTGPLFDEVSGNVAGGVLLISSIIGIILVTLLLVRHVGLSRVLRDFDARLRDGQSEAHDGESAR